MKKKFGFTLAEVLIALVVIGVIAAITVPSLIQSTNKQEYVSALKKAYSTFSQVSNQITSEEGLPSGASGWSSSPDTLYETFKKHLNVLKDCGSSTGCFEGVYKALKHTDSYTYDTRQNGRRLILADGTAVSFEWRDQSDGKQCTEGWGCAYITFDVNGKKRPNRLGRDVFTLHLLYDGRIKPAGCNEDTCAKNNSVGSECTCKVLREGAMNY